MQNARTQTATACLHELFEAQADLRPSSIAMVCGADVLSFQELEQRSNQLAHWLRTLGVGPGVLVGLYLYRSANPFIAMLASLKAGGAYVPIDPDYPAERVRYILADADVTVLVTEQALASYAASVFTGNMVLMDRDAAQIAQQSAARLPRAESGVLPHDLSYLIYTSGTTGRPKGVMIEHQSVVNFVLAANEIYGVHSGDRVYQGFSLAFDGAVEEIWLAFSTGATLVVGTQEVVYDASDVARLLTEQGVTIFSTVPTFLSLVEVELPTVRLLIVGGERCPPDLVRRWARPGRRMLNTYGPAETTVVATCAECVPGKPVTIGKALRGYETYVMDAAMRPVPPFGSGELYIGGVGVARGYVNRPDLTTTQFLRAPLGTGQRLYRTGDRVRLTGDGMLQFIGRNDSQVKIRGFRVELPEIEAVLHEHPMIRAAAIKVFESEGIQRLAAYVIVDGNATKFNRNEVLELLHTRLPDYMIPEYLDLVDALPTLPSGKIDRARLPIPRTALIRTSRTIVRPRTDLEHRIADVWEHILGIAAVSIKDDFFLDLGGHSLLAARTVSLMRETLTLAKVSIRDMYQYRTVERLAEYLSTSGDVSAHEDAGETSFEGKQSSQAVFESVSPFRRWTCVALQTLSLYLIYGITSVPLVVLFMLAMSVTDGSVSLGAAIGVVVALILGLLPTMLALSIIVKWLVIGRYQPGRYPVWGLYYFRWWLVTRIQSISGANFLTGTPLMTAYYRLMGAKVGHNCTLDTSRCQVFDLLTIGDDTSIGAGTQLLGCRVEDGMLILGTVDIGSRCFIGIHSALGLDIRMGHDARLGDLSLLADGEVITPGQSRRGSPSQPAEVTVPQAAPGTIPRRPLLFGFFHLLVIYAGEIFLALTAAPSVALINFAFLHGGSAWGMASIVLAAPLGVVSFCLFVAFIKALVLGHVEPGVYPLESSFYLRKWFINGLILISRRLVLPLYATLYLPPWFRLLGAKLGARVEVSTVSHISPDLLVADDESFFADAAIVGGIRIFRGHVEIGQNRVGRRSFVGNSAMLPMGSSVGDECLVGCLSVPPVEVVSMPNGSAWLGSPAFHMPTRQQIADFDDDVLYRPARSLYVKRLIIDALRILIPSIIATTGSVAFFMAVGVVYDHMAISTLIILAPLLAFTLSVGAALCVVAIKILVIGRYQPIVKPLWSMFVWLNELINGAYESIAAPMLSPLLGTLFFAPYLRLLGCKIGKHVYIGTTLFSEFDLVEVGDYAALNLGATVQTHLFEDRIMKASHLKISDECSVGNMAVILYDTEMRRGSSIGSLSLLMKGETVPVFARWHGIPAGATNYTSKGQRNF